MEPADRIIWSADVDDEQTLIAWLERMPHLRFIKIDRQFTEGRNLDILSALRGRGLQVFSDAKIIEIPSKLVGIAAKHLAHQPFMLNCMAGNTSTGILAHKDRDKIDGLKRFADACHRVGTRPCGVTVLTSKSDEVVTEEFNGRTSEDQVLFYVDLLLACGFTDVVCSPLEVPAIRAESRFDSLGLNTPGIRPAGSAVGDQARPNTPQAALAAGATRLVIGRPITDGDPSVNLKSIIDSIS